LISIYMIGRIHPEFDEHKQASLHRFIVVDIFGDTKIPIV
jgi:hypothetical protein